jgi:hypothetical protein
MKNVILASIAAGGLAVLLAGPAAAQDFTTKNVDPAHPFGSINVYNVGVDPTQVSTWAKSLSAGQKQEIVGRCSVILQNQQNYLSETTNFCQYFAIAAAENI